MMPGICFEVIHNWEVPPSGLESTEERPDLGVCPQHSHPFNQSSFYGIFYITVNEFSTPLEPPPGLMSRLTSEDKVFRAVIICPLRKYIC